MDFLRLEAAGNIGWREKERKGAGGILLSIFFKNRDSFCCLLNQVLYVQFK